MIFLDDGLNSARWLRSTMELDTCRLANMGSSCHECQASPSTFRWLSTLTSAYDWEAVYDADCGVMTSG
jgi:hypothetical protein